MDDAVLKPYSYTRMELAKLSAKRVALKHRAYSAIIVAGWIAIALEPTPRSYVTHIAMAVILLFVGILPMVPYFTYWGWRGKLLELHTEERHVRFNDERLILETASGVQSTVPFSTVNFASFGKDLRNSNLCRFCSTDTRQKLHLAIRNAKASRDCQPA